MTQSKNSNTNPQHFFRKIKAALLYRLAPPTFIYRQELKIIRKSKYFDKEFYLRNYPEVKNSGIPACLHYLLHGGFSGKNPSKEFNSKQYLKNNKIADNHGINPLVHFHRNKRGNLENELKKLNSAANPLKSYFLNNQGSVIFKWSHYFDIYHKHFQRYRNTNCVIVEIGVLNGGSLHMWRNYFGDKARIIGIDINKNCKRFEQDGFEIFIGSQSDRKFLQKLKTSIPKIDILIDDGGHFMEQQIISLEELYPHIADNGLYFCEDTHTSYWESFDGGYQKKDTFIEYVKPLIDKINSWHFETVETEGNPSAANMDSIHFYDSIVIIQKSKREKPWYEQRGYKLLRNRNNDEKEHYLKLKLELLGINMPDNIPKSFILEYPKIIEQYFPQKYNGRIWPKDSDTMIGFLRLSNLEYCVLEIIKNNIEGDLIETGVWKGGACIFMKSVLNKNQIKDKNIWLADSFNGLPSPDIKKYPDDVNSKLHEFDELKIPIDEVKKNFEKHNLLDGQVKFLKGWFKDTIPNSPIEKLSLLRLDGDMYESTIDVLFYLYPKLSVGGYCIIDDWGAIPACKKAVNDYRRTFNIAEEIIEIDWTGVFWKKEKQIKNIDRQAFNKLIEKNTNNEH